LTRRCASWRPPAPGRRPVSQRPMANSTCTGANCMSSVSGRSWLQVQYPGVARQNCPGGLIGCRSERPSVRGSSVACWPAIRSTFGPGRVASGCSRIRGAPYERCASCCRRPACRPGNGPACHCCGAVNGWSGWARSAAMRPLSARRASKAWPSSGRLQMDAGHPTPPDALSFEAPERSSLSACLPVAAPVRPLSGRPFFRTDWRGGLQPCAC
jgi:hypothetical protein